jgi:hypothetical protein
MSDAAIKDALAAHGNQTPSWAYGSQSHQQVQGEILLRAGLGGPAPTSGPPKPPTHKT